MENTFVLKLEEENDILKGIEKIASENNIEYGLFISAIGTIKDFELVSIEPKCGIARNKFKGEHEVNAVSGKLEKAGEKIRIHLRVSVGSKSFGTNSGQLLNGKAGRILEIGIRKVNLNKIIKG